MPDDVNIQPRTESIPPILPPENLSTPAKANRPSAEASLSAIMILCAAGLGGSFFLPWVNLLLGHPSGFDLQRHLGDVHYFYWAIPFFAAFAILAGLTKNSQRAIAHITGLVPFAILAFWLSQIGTGLMHNLDYGAYVALGCGLALELVALRLK